LFVLDLDVQPGEELKKLLVLPEFGKAERYLRRLGDAGLYDVELYLNFLC